MPLFTRRLRSALPLLLAALAACSDSAGPGDPVSPGDGKGPAVQVLLPLPSSREPGQVRLLGNAADSLSLARATYQVDGGAETELTLNHTGPGDSARAYFDATVALPSGTHRVVVHAYDAAGNRGSSGAIEFAVDASAPVVQLATPTSLTIAADTLRVRATVTDDYNLGYVDVALPTQGIVRFIAANRGKVTQHGVDTLVSLRVGGNPIDVIARDSVGNETRVRITATRTASPLSARFDAVAAYTRHGCGLRSGAAFCWGDGDTGELGNGRAISRDVPVAVAGGLAFASLSAASGRSCGLTPAGEAYCWGADFFGSLGRGTSAGAFYATPQRVAPELRFTRISAGAGGNTACAVSVAGEAYCWGMNSSGQAGVPRTTGSCTLGTTATPCVVTPTRVQGGLRFTSVSAGSNTTCGIAVDGRAYCWGAGLLGAGTANTLSEVPVAVAGTQLFASISVGNSSVCALTAAGEAYCWGANFGGALGDGTSENRLVPTRVASTVRFRSVGVVPEVTGTGLGVGACALGEDGAVYCWGAGRLLPSRLEGGLAFTSLSPNHRCGVTADRTAYCWTLTTPPVPVPGEY